jgi:hypothetical protein
MLYRFSIILSAPPPFFKALFFNAPLPFQVAANLIIALLKVKVGNKLDIRLIADLIQVKLLKGLS